MFHTLRKYFARLLYKLDWFPNWSGVINVDNDRSRWMFYFYSPNDDWPNEKLKILWTVIVYFWQTSFKPPSFTLYSIVHCWFVNKLSIPILTQYNGWQRIYYFYLKYKTWLNGESGFSIRCPRNQPMFHSMATDMRMNGFCWGDDYYQNSGQPELTLKL